MHILNTIIGGGISSRLFQSIREEHGLTYSIYSYQTNYSNAGLFTIYAGTRPSNASQVMELITKNINTLRATGISAYEFAKTKEQLKGSLLLSLESSSNRMFRIGTMELSFGNYITIDEVVSKIDKVTLEELHDILHTLLIPDKFASTVLGPINEEIHNAIKRF